MTQISAAQWREPRSLILLAGFLILVIGVGAFIGTQSTPGLWYASLDKPPFNPPSEVFAPVWFVLYVLIAVAGWRTYLLDGMGAGMVIWIVQMILNWLWSPAFFMAENLWLGVVVIVPMLITIFAFIAQRWNRDRPSALMFLPYAAWVSFATLLNVSLAILN